MTPNEKMHRINDLLSHVWVVRTFIKHSEEAEEDEALFAIQRRLYDFMLSLGAAWKEQAADAYLAQAKKKLHRLKSAAADFSRIQPEVSTHTNFEMARNSLEVAVCDIVALLDAE